MSDYERIARVFGQIAHALIFGQKMRDLLRKPMSEPSPDPALFYTEDQTLQNQARYRFLHHVQYLLYEYILYCSTLWRVNNSAFHFSLQSIA